MLDYFFEYGLIDELVDYEGISPSKLNEPIPKLSSCKLLCCLLIGQDQDSFYPSFHTL
jgi:hypothetical protein